MHENWDLKDRRCMLLLLVVFMGGAQEWNSEWESHFRAAIFHCRTQHLMYYWYGPMQKTPSLTPKTAGQLRCATKATFTRRVHKSSLQAIGWPDTNTTLRLPLTGPIITAISCKTTSKTQSFKKDIDATSTSKTWETLANILSQRFSSRAIPDKY